MTFSINITTYLSPRIVYVFIDPYMSTTNTIPIIPISSYCNNRTICRKTDWTSRIIISRFSINISPNLSPWIIYVFIDPYMSKRWSTTVFGTYSNYIPITRQTYCPILKRFNYSNDIGSNLWYRAYSFYSWKTNNTRRSPGGLLIRK